MATFDTTDISYTVGLGPGFLVRKSVEKNSASEASRSASFACQTFHLARSR